jgi:homotetrameric cytidine deaminase
MFEQHALKLAKIPRLRRPGIREYGDENTARDDIRQRHVTIMATILDADFFNLKGVSKDILRAGTELHDLGKVQISGRSKTGNDAIDEFEEAQAGIQIIRNFNFQWPWERDAFIEIYVRLTRSLTESQITELMPSEILINEDDTIIDWGQLKRLFQLYETYTEFITALQTYSLNISETDSNQRVTPQLDRRSKTKKQTHQTMRRIDQTTRAITFFRDTTVHCWPLIVEAIEEGIPSAEGFFINQKTEEILRHAKTTLNMELDLSCFNPEKKASLSLLRNTKKVYNLKIQVEKDLEQEKMRRASKVFTNREDLRRQLNREHQGSIVLTGGVFDLFHEGHLNFLRQASLLGKTTIVHIDSDKHTASRKGPTRPIISQEKRAQIIAALPFVNYVLITDDVFYDLDTVRQIQPSVIVKIRRPGSRSTTAQLQQRLQQYAPGVVVVEFNETPGISTSQIIEHIQLNAVYTQELSSEELSLIDEAKRIATNSYSYSNFRVGAVAKDESGKSYAGCNLSNASPNLATCAERHAITNAIVSGARQIGTLVLYSPGTDKYITPCGSCRQAILEFSPEDNPTRIIMANDTTTYFITDIRSLLPQPFTSRRRTR